MKCKWVQVVVIRAEGTLQRAQPRVPPLRGLPVSPLSPLLLDLGMKLPSGGPTIHLGFCPAPPQGSQEGAAAPAPLTPGLLGESVPLWLLFASQG